MNKNTNYNYSSKIKTEPEQYDYQRQLPIKEENHNNSKSPNSNQYQNYNKKKNNNMKNKFNNKQYNPQKNQGNNKFLGIKREKQYYNSDKSFNQNYNSQNNGYRNNNYSQNIKKEREDNYLNPPYYMNNNGYMNYNQYNNNIDDNYMKNKDKKYKQSAIELPIYQKHGEIMKEMDSSRIIIISGNTGCGKSTQVPQFIYGQNCKSKILMTQPRRIAAVSIAKRLAQEMGEYIGGKIGYHVSMNPRISSDTKIFVKTTGIFMEELIHRNLDYTHIIIDEVHERDVYVDLVLALIKYYFEQNPDSNVKVILMSATIAEDKFAEYLKDSNLGKKIPIIKILESRHNIQEFCLEEIITNLEKENFISDEIKKEIHNNSQLCIDQVKPVPVFKDELFPVVAGLIEKIENENPSNFSGVLIFVPGLAEIQELQNYLSRYFLNKTTLEFLILHSQISDDEQDMVFKNYPGKRKIILATNIAESSITISNIDFVIDFCLVKQTRFDEYQNTSILELKWCSKASVQQRKGRTGRTNKGFYFQLITRKLFNKLTNHPIAEILRTPLETPILKLKIYEPEKEPGDILLKTIEPPSEDKIINTLFRLEKMGALIQGSPCDKIVEIKETNLETGNNITRKVKKKAYKSGIITKVGRIFAELPIDIKYSRLIMIAFALGEIDLGITLAAIISQDKSMFLSSDKCNRFNIYNSKNYFCFNKSCDFIACYTAYKKWYYELGHRFVRSNVKFDTTLQHIKNEDYEKIRKKTYEQALDLRVLKEIIKVENDLKKRLTKFRLYSEHLSSFKNPKESINFQKEEDAFLLKVILAGTFYNQIFSPDYDDTRNIEEEILVSRDAPDQEKESELKTIRISNISEEDARKLIEIFDSLVKPDKITKDDYDEDCCIYKIKFDTEEAVKKILFITSSSIRRGKEIPIFEYIKNEKITTNEANSLGAKNDNSVIIKLVKEPEYYYRVHYFDEYNRENVFPDKDSINLIQIIPNLEQLKLCKLVTDSYNNKSGNTMKKFARYTSVLPPEQNFDKLIMLIFAPKYKMVGYKEGGEESTNEKEKYLKYIGFQSYELTGLKDFDEIDFRNIDFKYDRSKFIKLDYLITNYHLQIINEIRVLINEMIKFKFVSELPESMFYIEKENNDNKDDNILKDLKFKEDNEENELKKEEFDELFLEYKKKAKKISEKIRMIITEKKIRNISDKKYQELFDYIEKERTNKKNQNNTKKINDNTTIIENLSDLEMDEDDNENEKKEEVKKEEPKENTSYFGYINQIKELEKKVQKDDFLQIHEPLQITGESIFNNETREELNSREKRIKNLYNDVVLDLRTKESLAFNSDAWLVCSICCKEICPLREGNPVLTNEKVGEFRIFGPWLKDSLKLIFNKNKNQKTKKPLYDENEMNKFMEELKKENIEFDNLYTCPSRKHIIGYVRNDERFIYYESNLTIKYPDLTYEKIIGHEHFLNNFKDVHKKVDDIMKKKETDDFKKKIFCKLCGFEVKGELDEFKEHLDSDIHKDKMKELRKEFI